MMRPLPLVGASRFKNPSLMIGAMSFSNSRKPTSFNLKKIYNKWRMATLGLNLAGLIVFFFALGMSDLALPLMVVSVILLWAGFAVSYMYLKMEMGKPFESVARLSYFISFVLAIVLSVLTAISALS